VKSLEQRREICDRLGERYYPPPARREHQMRETILALLPERGCFLDAGAGPWMGMARHVTSKARVAVAMDVQTMEPKMLASGARGVMGDLRRIPFKESAFDVVSLRSVMEHLEDPPAAFREIARVLRPGGWIVALTPSSWYFASIIGRVLPERIGHRILGWVFGSTGMEHHEVFYRANTPRAVGRAAAAAGLRLVEARPCPHPPGYLKFSPALYRMGVAYDRVAGLTPVTRVLQASFLYVLKKP